MLIGFNYSSLSGVQFYLDLIAIGLILFVSFLFVLRCVLKFIHIDILDLGVVTFMLGLNVLNFNDVF